MAIRWEKFTVKAQAAVQRANELASEHGNPELLPVHLLAEVKVLFCFFVQQTLEMRQESKYPEKGSRGIKLPGIGLLTFMITFLIHHSE